MHAATTGKKGKLDADLPMKVRRRQSDAKWRANVASCYETLKHIIPVNKRASKRQISKAVILQETSKHISFLENILRTLLQEKAEKCAVDNTGQDEWVEHEISSIQNSFEEKLGEKMNGMNDERRYKRNRYKRYISENMMQESIQSTASVRSVIFEQKAAEQHPKKRSSSLSSVTKTMKKKMRTTSAQASASASVQEVPELVMDSAAGTGCNLAFLVDVPVEEGGNKGDCYVPDMPFDIVPERKSTAFDLNVKDVTEMFLCSDDKTPQFPTFETIRICDMTDKSDVDHRSIGAPPSTPVKSAQRRTIEALNKSSNDQESGITPVKLPKDWTLCPLTPVRGHRLPRNRLLSPSGCSVRSDFESDGDAQSLLCQEDMWLSDDEQDQTLGRFERTPIMENTHTSLRDVKSRPCRKRKRCDSFSSQLSDSVPTKQIKVTDGNYMNTRKDRNSSCRRSLNLTVKKEPVWDCNEDQGQKDFDGYLLFYQRMLSQLENIEPGAQSEKMSSVIYDMWQQLPSNQKKSIKEIAEAERLHETETGSQSDMEANDGLDFEASFYPLQEGDVFNTTNNDGEVPESPTNKDSESNQLAPNAIEISEVDIKPILPLSPWQSSDDPDTCPWSISDVSPLFGTSIHSMLTHIKVEKQD